MCTPPCWKLLCCLQPAAWLGFGWRHSLLLGGAAALLLALLRALLTVQHESVTYVRLLGVRVASRRRCGLWGSTRFLSTKELQGVIIHEVSVSARLQSTCDSAGAGVSTVSTEEEAAVYSAAGTSAEAAAATGSAAAHGCCCRCWYCGLREGPAVAV